MVHEDFLGGKAEEDISQAGAAKKIQAAWLGKSARLEVNRMKSWQNKALLFLEGGLMTFVALALVAADMVMTLGYGGTYPAAAKILAYVVSSFFLVELSLRFYCYAFLSRGRGVDCADFDFFTKDWVRMVDLVTVLLDLVATVILALSDNVGGGAKVLRSSKGARVARVAKLIRIVRVLRVAKASRLLDRAKQYHLTGREPMAMQRFHMKAPRDVEKGNRLEVMVPHLGKLQIQWPLYAVEDQPIQFHLPVVAGHHVGAIAPNCVLVKPSVEETAVAGGAKLQGRMGSFGWVQMWAPEDDMGLVPPPKKRGLLNWQKKQKRKTVHRSRQDSNGEVVEEDNEETIAEECTRLYKPFYDDYTKHRVWYQIMAFAPKPVRKVWTDLSLFSHELDHYKGCIVMTLQPGELRGERIECKIDTARGMLHGQEHTVHVPGVGDVNTTILATNEVTVPGIHGQNLKALGVLPWGARAVARKTLIPDVIGEVTFDFPAIMLPKATEIISMKFSKSSSGGAKGDADTTARTLGAGKGKKKVSAGKYLERETFTEVFQVMPKEFVSAVKRAQHAIHKQERKDAVAKRKEERRLKAAAKKGSGGGGGGACSCGNKGVAAQVKAADGSDEVAKGGGGGGCACCGGSKAVKEAVATPPAAEALGAAEAGEAQGGTEMVAPKQLTDDASAEAPTAEEPAASAPAASVPAAEEPVAEAPLPSTEGGAPAGTISDEAGQAPERRASAAARDANSAAATAAAAAASEAAAHEAAALRASVLDEAKEEAAALMAGVDSDALSEAAEEHQRILLPRIGKFDVEWPSKSVETFNISFPAIKPAKVVREEVLSLIEMPSESDSPMARRYQFGWVLVEMHETSPNGSKVFLRLPAYVSHKQRALGSLDPDDFASPYSNRLHGHSAEVAAAATAAGGASGGDAEARAAKAEARVAQLEAQLAALARKAEAAGAKAGAAGANAESNPAEEYKNKGSSV